MRPSVFLIIFPRLTEERARDSPSSRVLRAAAFSGHRSRIASLACSLECGLNFNFGGSPPLPRTSPRFPMNYSRRKRGRTTNTRRDNALVEPLSEFSAQLHRERELRRRSVSEQCANERSSASLWLTSSRKRSAILLLILSFSLLLSSSFALMMTAVRIACMNIHLIKAEWSNRARGYYNRIYNCVHARDCMCRYVLWHAP